MAVELDHSPSPANSRRLVVLEPATLKITVEQDGVDGVREKNVISEIHAFEFADEMGELKGVVYCYVAEVNLDNKLSISVPISMSRIEHDEVYEDFGSSAFDTIEATVIDHSNKKRIRKKINFSKHENIFKFFVDDAIITVKVEKISNTNLDEWRNTRVRQEGVEPMNLEDEPITPAPRSATAKKRLRAKGAKLVRTQLSLLPQVKTALVRAASARDVTASYVANEILGNDQDLAAYISEHDVRAVTAYCSPISQRPKAAADRDEVNIGVRIPQNLYDRFVACLGSQEAQTQAATMTEVLEDYLAKSLTARHMAATAARKNSDVTERGTPRIYRLKREGDNGDAKLNARVPRELRDRFRDSVKNQLYMSQATAVIEALEDYLGKQGRVDPN